MNNALVAERPAHVPENLVVDFNIFAPPGGKKDVYAAWLKLQAPGIPDVVWSPYNGGHWIATRTHAITEVYSDHKRFSSHIFLLPRESGELFSNIPLGLNPPENMPIRALLNPHFSPTAVLKLKGLIRELAIEIIEGFRQNGRCSFTHDFAEVYPLRIFMLLVNLPFSDAARLKQAADELLRPSGALTFTECVQRLADYITPYIEERRKNPGDDLLSVLLGGEIKGRPLTSDEALRLSIALLAGGLDTVANFSSFAMLFLAQHPEHRRELIADPSLIPSAVDELLRRFGVSTSCRVARSDFDFYGAPIKNDDMILSAGILVGLDEETNPNAMEVDFHRKNGKHATFGFGTHICAGMHLARLELCIMVEEWLARIPEFDVEPGADITFTSGHVFAVDRLPLVWDPAKTRVVENDRMSAPAHTAG